MVLRTGVSLCIYERRYIIGVELSSIFSGRVQLTGETKSSQKVAKKGVTCIKGLIWPPLEPKTENCFSQISFDWFIRRR